MAKSERRTLRSEQVDLIAQTGKTHNINIPRDKFIRRIILRQHGDFDLDTLGSVVPSPTPSLIDHLRLIRDGSEVLVSADPSRLQVMDYLEHGGVVNTNIPDASTGDNQHWSSVTTLDFMINPRNNDEVFIVDSVTGKFFMVMIPAMDLSSLKLEIAIDSGLSVTALAGLFDTAPTTISGATAYLDVTIEEFFLEPEDPNITRDDVFELRTIQTEKTLGTSITEHPFELTTGVLMRRLALFQHDDSGGVGNPARPAQGAPLVDQIKVKQSSPISWTPLNEDFESLQAQDIQEYNVTKLDKRSLGAGTKAVTEDRETGVLLGFTVLDFDDSRNLQGAMDLTGMKSGDIKVLMRTTSTATTSDKMVVLEHYLI